MQTLDLKCEKKKKKKIDLGSDVGLEMKNPSEGLGFEISVGVTREVFLEYILVPASTCHQTKEENLVTKKDEEDRRED